jgi:hypothetical protein
MRRAMSWGIAIYLSVGPSFSAPSNDASASLIKEAEAAMCSKLRECDSAKWRNETVKLHPSGTHYVCAEVNAKNGFGGYAGFEPFVYFSKEAPPHLAGLAMTEADLSDMELVHPFGAPIPTAITPSDWGLYLMTGLCATVPDATSH